MSDLLVPAVVDALVALAPAYLPPDVQVVDGPPIDGRLGDFLFVGVSDPEMTRAGDAGRFEVVWPMVSATVRDETASIVCVAAVARGNSDMREARTAAFEIAGGVARLLRINPTLGVVGNLRTNFTEGTWTQDQTGSGAVVMVTFRVGYDGRI